MIGIGVNLAMAGFVLTYLIPFFLIIQKLDPLHIWGDHWLIWLLRFCLQTLFMYCTCRNCSFLGVLLIVIFQAYVGSLSLLSAISQQQYRIFTVKVYVRLTVLHKAIISFMDSLVASELFLCHSIGVVLFWLGIRDWTSAPFELVIVFPLLGADMVIWLFANLTAQSHVRSQSVKILGQLGNGKRLGILTTRKLKSLKGLEFRAGSFVIISNESPGNLVNSLANNVATATLAF